MITARKRSWGKVMFQRCLSVHKGRGGVMKAGCCEVGGHEEAAVKGGSIKVGAVKGCGCLEGGFHRGVP